jgi:hypothetical protein
LDYHEHVSQRSLAEQLGMAVSLVNRLIAELVSDGHVEVVDPNVRPFAYRLSAGGRDYRRLLSHAHFASVVGTFREVEERIRQRLRRLKHEGANRLVFYGTGNVMEVTYPLALAEGLEVVGLVDDDPIKHGESRGMLVVEPPGRIEALEPDAVVITTFRHAGEIQKKLGRVGKPEYRLVEI